VDRTARRTLTNRSLRIIAGLAISAVCLYFAFRAVPLRQLWTTAASVPGPTLLACFAIGSFTLFLRSVRWRVLLQAAEPIPLSLAFTVNSAGQMGNAILPARLGDLFRAANLGRAGLNSGFALATVLVERVLDTGFLVLVSALALTTFANVPGWLVHAARLLALAATSGLIFTLVLPRFDNKLLRMVESIAPARWHATLLQLAGQFLLGLRSLHHSGRVLSFMALTSVIWFVDCTGIVILSRGLTMTLSLEAAAVFITSVALSSAVPAAPGNLGVYQMVAVAVLGQLGFARPQALSFSVIAQAMSGTTVVLWGLASAWFLSARSARPAPAEVESHTATTLEVMN
jgi:uncharacterized protein (TIRG00374 family)